MGNKSRSVRAKKIGGGYQYTGYIVSSFLTRAGAPRVVFEFDPPIDGVLHIFRPDQIEILTEAAPSDAELFRFWADAASQMPSTVAQALASCIKPEDYRNVLTALYKELVSEG